MSLVVDASVVLKWIIPEPDSGLALALRGRPELAAPELLIPECVNAIRRRARIEGFSDVQRNEALLLVAALDLVLEPMQALATRAGDLAQALAQPAYDCFYLALAERRRVPFVTADARLAAAIRRSAGVTPAPVLSLAEAASL